MKNKIQILEKQKRLEKEVSGAWSTDTRVGALLESVAVPYSVFEYADTRSHLLRGNEAYIEIFGNESVENYLCDRELYKFQAAIAEATISHKSGECECLFLLPGSSNRWYNIRLSYIGAVEKTALIGATFTDVSIERMLEKELNTFFHAIHHKEEKGSLLIVEDQEVSREILRSLFVGDYEILVAEDGQKGLEILKKNSHKIMAILLDMVMPVMDGREFLSYKNKMADAADIPVMVISSEDNEATQISMLENGVNDYVTKPFIPAMVKKRLANVLEYSSRFRNLVKEYKNFSDSTIGDGRSINLTKYEGKQLHSIISFLGKIFDVVRLVDPRETTIIEVMEDGTISRQPYSCFSIWGKSTRCENCSSICALNGHCALNKFELLKNDIFYVISQPVSVHLEGEEQEKVVLEIASRISETAGVDAEEVNRSILMIEEMQAKIYIDSLTEAYNRRYLDEMMFLHHEQNHVAEEVILIMLDLYQFKQINDIYGHQTGDNVLIDVVKALKTQTRQADSVIRYGGDEFLVIVPDLPESKAETMIQRFQEAVAGVTYGEENQLSAIADFGYSYTKHFRPEGSMLTELIKLADERMYETKRIHKINAKAKRM
ncbi:MAG: diguanylate cyclase [Lachnospiraceae bacterium]|nr:diguanylate cyclase [Lachnospiraceae bacterium]